MWILCLQMVHMKYQALFSLKIKKKKKKKHTKKQHTFESELSATILIFDLRLK